VLKKEEGRRKKEEGRRKKEERVIPCFQALPGNIYLEVLPPPITNNK